MCNIEYSSHTPNIILHVSPPLQGHLGRGVWHCETVAHLGLLVTGGADSSVKLWSLPAWLPPAWSRIAQLEGMTSVPADTVSGPLHVGADVGTAAGTLTSKATASAAAVQHLTLR